MNKDLFKKYNYLFPFIYILVIWFIFASPYFIKGLVPFPSTYQVNHYHPWSLYEGFWGPVKNGAMPDIIDQIYPWRHFTIQTWMKGQIPFWNPYNFGGNPHLANFQSAVFSPFNILFFVFSFIDAWSMLILLQPLIAGFATYFLLREYAVSKIGSCISSISFMFCGFIVVWMAYGTLAMAITSLPLALLLIEKYSNTLNKKFLVFLSLVIPFSFFSGHFQTSLYFLTFSFLYLLYKGISLKNYRLLLVGISVFAIGLIISLIQIIPSIQFYFYSVRSSYFIAGGGIPFYYLVTSFAPDFFGNPVTRNDWLGNYAEYASFIGIIPLTLVFFAIDKKQKNTLFFLVIGIIALILALDSPLLALIGLLKIPVLSTSNPTRIIVVFNFAFSVLAGFGFDNFLSSVMRRSNKALMIRIAIIGVFILTAWIFLQLKFLSQDKVVIAQRNMVLPSLLYVLLIVMFFVGIFNKWHKKTAVSAITIVILLLVSFDSLRFVQKWMPFDPRNLVFPPVPVIKGIQENISHGRIFGNLGAQVETYYGFPSLEGYDPLYIERYGEFIRASENGIYLPSERSVVKINRNAKYIDRLLNILGVELIFHPIADTNQSWAFPVWSNSSVYKQVYTDEKFKLYKNTTVIPRGSLYYSYIVRSQKYDILKKFYSDDFDYRNTLILEEDPHINKANNNVSGTVSYVLDSPNKVIMNVNTASAAILFLSDNYYPGWSAKVNGVLTKIYRADYSFRAVLVPQGKSTVEFEYFPSL